MRTHELTLELGNWIRYYATGTIPSLFQCCVSDFIMLPTFWHSQDSQGFPVRHSESLRSFSPAQDPVLSTLQEVHIILSALLYSCLSSAVFLKTTVLVLAI